MRACTLGRRVICDKMHHRRPWRFCVVKVEANELIHLELLSYKGVKIKMMQT